MARVVSVLGVLALLFFVERSLGERANITLVNNGYEGMLVAIAESVPISESDEIIRRIKVRIYPCIINYDKIYTQKLIGKWNMCLLRVGEKSLLF